MRFHNFFGFSFCRNRRTTSCPANTAPTQNITSANTNKPAAVIARSVSENGRNGRTSSKGQGTTDAIVKRIPNFAIREKRMGRDMDICRIRVIRITMRQIIIVPEQKQPCAIAPSPKRDRPFCVRAGVDRQWIIGGEREHHYEVID